MSKKLDKIATAKFLGVAAISGEALASSVRSQDKRVNYFFSQQIEKINTCLLISLIGSRGVRHVPWRKWDNAH